MKIKNNKIIQKSLDGKHSIIIEAFGQAEKQDYCLELVDSKYEKDSEKPYIIYEPIYFINSEPEDELVAVDYNEEEPFFLFQFKGKHSFGVLFPSRAKQWNYKFGQVEFVKGYYKKDNYASTPSVELLLQGYPDLIKALPKEYFAGKRLDSIVAALQKGLEYNMPDNLDDLHEYKNYISEIKAELERKIKLAEEYVKRETKDAYERKEKVEDYVQYSKQQEELKTMNLEIAHDEAQQAIDSLLDFKM